MAPQSQKGNDREATSLPMTAVTVDWSKLQ